VDINTDPANAGLGSYLATVLLRLQDDTEVTQLGEFLSATFNRNWSCRFLPFQLRTPRHVVAFNGNELICGFLGAQNFDLAGDFVQGCGREGPHDAELNFNWAAWLASFHGYADAMFIMGGSYTNVLWIGHSYGGLVAACCAARYKQQFPDRDCSVITFGSPRSTYDEGRLGLTNVPWVRWMNFQDPIPRLPPHAGEGDTMRSFVPGVVRERWSQQNHGGIGRVVYTDGRIEGRTVPPAIPGGLEASLGNFLRSSDTIAAYQHSINEYVWALRNAGRQNGSFNEPPLPIVPPPQVPNIQIQLQLGIEAPIGQLPPPVEAAFVSTHAALPVKHIYKAKRIGRSPCVVYGEELLTVAPGMKAARRLASRLNSALANWNASRFGDAKTLIQSIVDNFTGAQ